MRPEEIFLANLELIERFARSTCRRFRMEFADVEDFTSALKLKLIENDYDVLRQFKGRSSVSTFLYVVIQRFYLDYRDHQWGRWRPSAEARRQGDVAVLLERLNHRDGLSSEEACIAVRQRHPEVTAEDLQRIQAALPVRGARTRGRTDDDSALESIASPRLADESLLASERLKQARRASGVFTAVLRDLSAEEQLILRMRFVQGLRVATIATVLQLDQKRLYKTIDKLIGTLRKALLGEGLSSSDIGELLEHGAEGIEIPFLHDEGIQVCDPSNQLAKEGPAGASQAE